jgi:prepilin peptidase CpaA
MLSDVSHFYKSEAAGMTKERYISSIRYVIGGTAMLTALLSIFRNQSDLVILAASAYFFLICASDTVHSEIPNALSLSLALIGLLYNIGHYGLPGVLFAGMGTLTGLALLVLPFLMGGMGAGDVKALAALGALLGPAATFQVFLYMGLIGGALGLLFHLLAMDIKAEIRRMTEIFKNAYLTRDYRALKPASSRLRFPYATAIAFGFFAFARWGNII